MEEMTNGDSGAIQADRRVRTGMKRILLIPAALMFVPVALAERIPDRTWDNAVEELRQKLQFQASTGDWVIVENSPEEGFSAGTTDGRGNFLFALCIPGTGYGAFISSDGKDSLGADYDDLDDQPVTLNWRSPNLTQRKQWSHLSLEESDSVTLMDFLKQEETDAFLDRLTRHRSLNAVQPLHRPFDHQVPFPANSPQFWGRGFILESDVILIRRNRRQRIAESN